MSATSLDFTVYRPTKTDQFKHPHFGVYVDFAASFDLPVGPFQSKHEARAWVEQNRERLIERPYPAQAA